MEEYFSHDVKLGSYLLSIRLLKQKKSLYFRVTNQLQAFTYAVEWSDSQNTLKDLVQLYKRIKDDKGKSIALTDQNSTPIIYIFEKYRVVLKKEEANEENLSDQFSIIPDQQQVFIYQAAIRRNLYNRQIVQINSFSYNIVGLIYGPDQGLVDNDEYHPNRVLQNIFQNKETIIGTGFLVSPNLVLTCAHVMFHKNKQNWKKSFKRTNLQFQLKNKFYKIVDIKISEKYTKQRYQKQYRKFDYSLLLLESQIDQQFASLCFDYSQKCKAMIYGFSQDNQPINFSSKMIGFKQSGAADYIGWIKDGYLYYDIKTGSGQSGSPVMIFINGIKMAIGIHIYYSEQKKKNVALHLNKERIQQILTWENQLTDGLTIRQIKVFSSQDMKNQTQKVKRQNKRIDISGKKLEILILEVTNHIRKQNYPKAIRKLKILLQLCQQKGVILKQVLDLLLIIAYRKNQNEIDLRCGKKLGIRKQKSSSQQKRELKKIKKQQKKYNIIQNRRMRNNLKKGSQLFLANELIQNTLEFIKIQQQHKQKLLVDKKNQLTRITINNLKNMQHLVSQKQNHIDSIKKNLQTQINKILIQLQKINLKQVIFKIELAHNYLATKNQQKLTIILKQFQQLKGTNFSKTFQYKYQYLLASIKINKLDIIKEKKKQKNKIKKQSTIFNINFVEKKEQQINQLELNKKILQECQSNSQLFELLINKINQSECKDGCGSCLKFIILGIKTIRKMQQQGLVDLNQSFQIRSKLEHERIFLEVVDQISHILVDRKYIDFIVKSVQEIFIRMANILNEVEDKNKIKRLI